MQRQPMKTSYLLILISGMLAMAGCGGEMSFKRGASAQDFQTEKQRCQSAADDEKTVDQCLQQQGWLVVGPDKPLLPLSRGETKTISVADDAMTSTSGLPVDPLETLQINSWWRAGAGPEKLMADGELCTAELGEAHKPEANMSSVTRGFLGCMQEKGWAALLAPLSYG